MEVTYEVFVGLYHDARPAAGAEAFIEKFAAYGTYKGGAFSFPTPELAREAMAIAKQRRLDAQLFYFCRVRPEELKAQPGFYLAVNIEEYLLTGHHLQGHFLADADIAFDLQTDNIIINERGRRLLEREAQGPEFVPVGEANGSNWFRLEHIPPLPEPVFVPQPAYFRQNESPLDTYAVQSDGRDVLTKANIAWLQERAMAVSHHVRTPTHQVSWRPRVIITGELLVRLKETIRGLTMPPTPLLTEEQASSLALE